LQNLVAAWARIQPAAVLRNDPRGSHAVRKASNNTSGAGVFVGRSERSPWPSLKEITNFKKVAIFIKVRSIWRNHLKFLW
jgi:hypothetical protein